MFSKFYVVNYSMKKLILFFVCTLFLNFCIAQKKCSVLNGMAYVTTILPGNIPVDENGNPRKLKENKMREIYLVTNCDVLPQIKAIKYGNRAAKFQITKWTKNSLQAGIDLQGEKVIMCEATDGYLWKIDLNSESLQSFVYTNQKIYIEGNIKKRPFKLIIKKETALQGMPTY